MAYMASYIIGPGNGTTEESEAIESPFYYVQGENDVEKFKDHFLSICCNTVVSRKERHSYIL